ncbi:hypothetical protein DPMN_100743 [Dreissena polymorpha]|uniref:Uncharacterized protein n=1 Tax=Dreissena polymorpha TaxID=45954 RepID=A0A9D4LHV2_DREPO|nr:hypothetical protein DPMN_100743 [Dreissena polymorpha]
MAKSKAQRMREYRERKNQQIGEEEWLRQERNRRKIYFTPMAQMDEDKQLKARERNRKCQQSFRKKKQQQKGSDRESLGDRGNEVLPQPSTSMQSNENEVTSLTDT